MPDAQGFPTPDELINGPTKAEPQAVAFGLPSKPTPEQIKGISLVMSGLAYVVIAIRPTVAQGDGHIPAELHESTGADFLTTLGGDPNVLRSAKDELPGVIHRLYGRSGLL